MLFSTCWDTNREDLALGRLHRTGLTPPEWRARTERAVAEVEKTGTIQRVSRKSNFAQRCSRVPVLLGATSFDETATKVSLSCSTDLADSPVFSTSATARSVRARHSGGVRPVRWQAT